MALMALVGDRHELVEVLALSEVHYVVDLEHSFVTEELFVRTRADMHYLCAYVHGQLPAQEQEIERVRKRWSFEALLRHGYNNVECVNGIYDHSDTWRLNTDTNMYYEGPEPFRRVQAIPGRPDSEKRIYGCVCHIPAIYGVPRRTAFGSLIEIHRRSPNEDFHAGDIYALRFGYYLKRPAFRRPLAHHLLYMPYGEYKVHIFSFPQQARQALETEGVLPRLSSSRLYLTLSPFVDRYKGEVPQQDWCVTPGDLERFKTTPTTVVWFVVPRGWTFHINPLTMERDDRAFQLVDSEYVLPTSVARGTVPYRECYVKLADHINRLKGVEFMMPDEEDDIMCLINPRRTGRALAEIARDSVPFLALAVAVLGLYREKPAFANEATSILLWSSVTYAAVVLLRIVWRYFIPEVWRRVSVLLPVRTRAS